MAGTEQFKPSEAAIAKVLEEYTPRQVAIAYLRASRRARSAEVAFKVLDSVTEATDAARSGDFKATKSNLDKMLQTLRSHEETGEAQS